MLDTRIKICGITTPEDALVCAEHGADYLGLVFAKSPRQVTLEQAKSIRNSVPDAMLVGVFADAPIDEVVDVCGSCNINIVQLHGNETPEYCDELQTHLSLSIIKTFSSRQLVDACRMRDYTLTSYFLFDIDKDDRPRCADSTKEAQDHLWSKAATKRSMGYRIFLAGALNADNVKDAVNSVGPYCVDVSSGVEKSPGVKDSDAVIRFIRTVRN